jgi:hypothetical protein
MNKPSSHRLIKLPGEFKIPYETLMMVPVTKVDENWQGFLLFKDESL